MGTPSYLAYARPGLAGYLFHPSVLVIQALPYAVAAALWLPAWRWKSDRATVFASALLLAASLLMYTPVVWTPERWGGDMIALAFLAMSGVTLAVVLVLSGATAALSRVKRPAAG